jgi:Spy/CpxP family protein refolding chaperone
MSLVYPSGSSQKINKKAFLHDFDNYGRNRLFYLQTHLTFKSMNDKQEKIIKLRNLIYELVFDRKMVKNKKELIHQLQDELEELQTSLDQEIYSEDSQPTLNF